MLSNFSERTQLVGHGNVAMMPRRDAIAGGIKDFEALYREHVGAVFGLCYRLTGQREAAEDCAQETFVAAWRALPQFEARSALATWLHRIAVNKVIARNASLAAKFEQVAARDDERAFDEAGGGDCSPPLDLERAICALPDGSRHVLVLVGIYGYSHAEAAQLLGIAAGTCRAHLHRARQLLGKSFGLNEETS
jgi:RNA polymerase sigma-70 factor (ECF subfamily)